MIRNPAALAYSEFDVVIVGGGIFGACAAWDATLRGLSVALVEREDFGAGVSANSFKFIHGGIRYLQHADLIRLRSSCHERSAFLRVAPHLVQPLPVVIPTYGFGRRGKVFLGAGMYLYDLLTLGRNRKIVDHTRHIPWTRFMGRKKLLELFPDLKTRDLTGAAVFSDAQMYNPPRLVLAFIQSAVHEGAQVANYVEAAGFLRQGHTIQGIQARDRLTGEKFHIRAKVVLNAAGPWAERLLGTDRHTACTPRTYSRDACFVINRRFSSSYALAIAGRTRDPDAVLSRDARHLFLVPWRDRTLIGVWHVISDADPDQVTVSDADLQGFIEEINWAYPSLNLSLQDVTTWNAGLVPFGENELGATDLRYGKRSALIDHREENGIDGLVTLIGIRYTMGRADAANAIDMICEKMGRSRPRAPTDCAPIHGGRVKDFEGLVKRAASELEVLPVRVVRALVHNHGSNYRQVVTLTMGKEPALLETISSSAVLKVEIVNAVRNEMAVRLTDVVFRRTDLATGGNPCEAALVECSRLVAEELGWDDRKSQEELRRVRSQFPVSLGAS
ncbi:MAG: glycerol-3-phosphate dehydrogenase/oxidase [Gammaproteobacteria bacterium]